MYVVCDRLIVLRIASFEEAEVVYDGDGAPVWQAAGKMQKNGQRTIGLSKLYKIADAARRGSNQNQTVQVET